MTLAPTRCFVGLFVAALLVARPQAQTPSAPPPPQQTGQPLFKAATDVIVIDVAVTNDTGDAVSGLTAADFKLEVDGKPRRVVSAQFLDQAESTKTTTGASGAPATRGGAESFSSNETVSGGRLVLFLFDLEGIPPGGGRDAARAASAFLDSLQPGDQAGLVALPNGTNVPFTADRAISLAENTTAHHATAHTPIKRRRFSKRQCQQPCMTDPLFSALMIHATALEHRPPAWPAPRDDRRSASTSPHGHFRQ